MPEPIDRRRLGLTSATGVVISSMVGAGVFTTSGYSLADLGSPLIVLYAWFVAGLVAVCGAIGYGELARRFQESGGEYLFLSRTIHPAIGFLAGLVSLLAGFTGAIAFAATAFEQYSGLTGPAAVMPAGSIAIVAIIVATLLHLFQVRWGARVQNLLVASKFVLLAVFLGIAFATPLPEWSGVIAWQDSDPVPFSLTQFSLSLIWISLSYCGFNASIYIAGEVREAAVNVPRAMLIGTALVSLFYLLLNAVFVLAPAPEMIAGQEQVAVIAARVVGGDGLALLIRCVVLVSLFTSVSVMIMTGPRVYAKMSEDGLMPGWLKFDRPTPRAAILLQAALASGVVLITTLKQLLSYLGFTLSISAALTVASLMWVPRRAAQPIWVRPIAAMFSISTLVIACLAARNSPLESAVGLLTILAGLGIYWLAAPRSG